MKARSLSVLGAGLCLATAIAIYLPAAPAGAATARAASSPACKAVQKKFPKYVGKTITVATDPEIPDFSFIDSKKGNSIQGFNVDWTASVMDCLGAKYKILSSSFEGLIPTLEAGRAETVNSNLVATAERLKAVNFVTFQKQLEVFLLPKGDPKHITTAADLCGHSIAVVPSSLEQKLAEKVSKECTAKGKSSVSISTYTSLAGGTQAVLTGRSDVFMEPDSFAFEAEKQFPGKLTNSPTIPQGTTLIGWAITKSNTTLAKALVAASLAQQKKGEETRLLKKWGQNVNYVSPAKFEQ